MSFRIAITTLGCKVNQADSDHLADAFATAGCTVVDPAEPADAYVVNTCTVTLVADRKARKLVRGVAKQNPAAVVAVTGCYVEGVGRAVFERMPEVEVVRGNSDRGTLPEAVLLELRRRRAMGLLPALDGSARPPDYRPRAMLKVQDGCSHVCGFCIVPAVRGGLRSRRPDDVLEEVRRKVDEGVTEFVLCGIRLGTYGWDWPERAGKRFAPLNELVEALAVTPGVERLRLSSILPLDVGPDLFPTLASLPPVCEHLHLPLQSGDDGILKAMGRGYKTRRFADLVDQARAHLGDLALATDVMGGYPGESEKAFANTLSFCREMAFADMHIFSYSPRPGTPAAELDDVPAEVKRERSQILHELRGELRETFRARRVGQRAEILVETSAGGVVEGLTRDYIRCRAVADGAPGETVAVTIAEVDAELALGVVDEPAMRTA